MTGAPLILLVVANSTGGLELNAGREIGPSSEPAFDRHRP